MCQSGLGIDAIPIPTVILLLSRENIPEHDYHNFSIYSRISIHICGLFISVAGTSRDCGCDPPCLQQGGILNVCFSTDWHKGHIHPGAQLKPLAIRMESLRILIFKVLISFGVTESKIWRRTSQPIHQSIMHQRRPMQTHKFPAFQGQYKPQIFK